ncbi:MAG: hypothetical protein PHR85_08475 [Malikia sp.]|nr:hypothetical protein [Malikia sp.]
MNKVIAITIGADAPWRMKPSQPGKLRPNAVAQTIGTDAQCAQLVQALGEILTS